MNARRRVRIARVRSMPKATAVSATPATNPLIRACARPILVRVPLMRQRTRVSARPIAARVLLMRQRTRACARPTAVRVLLMRQRTRACARPTAVRVLLMRQRTRACARPTAVPVLLMRRHIRVSVAGNVPVQGTILGLVSITSSIRIVLGLPAGVAVTEQRTARHS